MPISKYYKGHGAEVMANMKREYGSAKGERVFYATANKRKQKPRKGSILHGKGVLIGLLLLGWASLAEAQIIPGSLTTGQETLTVAATTVGITANTCGTGNLHGAIIQVLTGAVYMALHSPTATAASTDFALNIGDVWYFKPAVKGRFIQQSASSTIKVQCVE